MRVSLSRQTYRTHAPVRVVVIERPVRRIRNRLAVVKRSVRPLLRGTVCRVFPAHGEYDRGVREQDPFISERQQA